MGAIALAATLGLRQLSQVPGKCKMTAASGLGYSTTRQGRGDHPSDSDVVLVNYAGQLSDGNVFDKGERAPFPVDQVVPGFSEGLKLMQRGGRYRLCIPARLGYGEASAGPIPPNADLIFDVELIDFTSTSKLEAALAKAKGVAPPVELPEGVD